MRLAPLGLVALHVCCAVAAAGEAPAAESAAETTAPLLAHLERAASLFQRGLLTAEEFAATKQRLLLAPAATAAAPSKKLKTFGTGWSAMTINSTERTIFTHSVAPGTVGVMTHFWITGMGAQGLPKDPSLPSLLSNGTDNVTVRYYIDGEADASIEFKPPMAAGVGFSDNRAANGDPTGMANAKIGRAGMGGWCESPRPRIALPPCRAG